MDHMTKKNRIPSSSPLNPNAPVFTPIPPHKSTKNHHQSKHRSTPKPISFIHLNARSLLNKTNEMMWLCNRHSYNVIAVTETWLDDSIPNGSILPNGYSMACRSDRSLKRGGGALIMCRNDIDFVERRDLCFWKESAWIELTSKNHNCKISNILIGCFYRPPSSKLEDLDSFIEAFEKTIEKIDLVNTTVVIAGDFNATNSSWCVSDKTNVPGHILQNTFLSLGLYQQVTFPTHLDSSGMPRALLDLVLSNDTTLIKEINSLAPLGRSDHLMVECALDLSFKEQTTQSSLPQKVWCYSKADVVTLNNFLLATDWSPINYVPTVDSAWDFWKNRFFEAVDKFIPSKYIKKKIKPRLPWITVKEEMEIKKKHQLFKKFKRTLSPHDREAFKWQRNFLTGLLRRAERQYIATLKRRNNSARFWNYARLISGKSERPPIPDIADNSGAVLQSSAEKAQAFNAFFTQETSLPSRTRLPSTSSLRRNPKSFCEISTTPEEIYQILRTLPNRKSPGLDCITTDLLKLCASGISSSLSLLFNRSFDEGSFPSAWKDAVVIPVFKRGDNKELSNYRPIALLSQVGKVCEKTVLLKLNAFLKDFLTHSQSGFRQKDSTSFQLLRIVQEWSDHLDSSKYVGVLFFDLKKAFDKVWHKGLLCKLEAAGIRGLALTWFRSYLSDRQQRVRIGSSSSPPLPVEAGVPQGAILSPLLFLIYINDITSCIDQTSGSKINLFADDTSLYMTNEDPRRLESSLQLAADALLSWFHEWQLLVNVQKTALMLLRRRGMHPAAISIKINGQNLAQQPTHKHLGLTFNDTLTWTDHIETICSKAARQIGFLFRIRKRLSVVSRQHLYTASIRCTLEYGSLVWCGLSGKDVRKLESIQRRAARMITGTSPSADLSHPILLAHAGLTSLTSRRKATQGIFAGKCTDFENHCFPPHFKELLRKWIPKKSPKSLLLRNSELFLLPRPQFSVLKRSPLYQCFSVWNALPKELRLSKSASAIEIFFS